MRRVAAVVTGMAVSGGCAIFLSSWVSQTCSPLDRLFGQSGCVSTIEIANLAPLSRDTMSAQAADATASLLGWERNGAGGANPVLVRVDLDEGREIARFPLAMGRGLTMPCFRPMATGYSSPAPASGIARRTGRPRLWSRCTTGANSHCSRPGSLRHHGLANRSLMGISQSGNRVYR